MLVALGDIAKKAIESVFLNRIQLRLHLEQVGG